MKNTLYGIGLDIGVASVGWAVVGLNGTGEPVGLHRLGVRIFDKAEQPKTGEALPRRGAWRAGCAAVCAARRCAVRTFTPCWNAAAFPPGKRSRKCLKRAAWKTSMRCAHARWTSRSARPNFRAFCCIYAQRRGFKSNRRTASDGEDGRLLAAVNENRRRMAQGGWRTVGEMLYRHEAFALHKRNKADEYLSTVGRDMVAKEASRCVFSASVSWAALGPRRSCRRNTFPVLLRQRSFR